MRRIAAVRGLGRLAVVLALAGVGQAEAVRPPSDNYLGVEPGRVRTYDRAMQDMLRNRPVWQDFVSGEGAGWAAKFDERTGTPFRMWGPGLDFGKLSTEAQVGEVVLAFVDRHADLLGVRNATPVVKSVAYDADGDAWYVDVDTLIDGLPVYRGGLTFRFKQDRLTMVGAMTYPETPVVGAVTLSPGAALTAAIIQGPAAVANHTGGETVEMLLPIEHGGKLELRAVWQVRTETQTPRGMWVSFVDAETGQLLNVHNEVRYFTGEVLGQHDVRAFNGQLAVAPLPYARITGGNPTVFTNANGSFTTSNASSYTLSLAGQRVSVVDDLGTVTPNIGAQASRTVTAADFGGRQPALTTYHWLHEIQNWAVQYAPSVSWSDGPTTATVNIADVCNAFWDGTVNFFQAGSGCANTGRQADVIIHEWGHGFHYYSLRAGDFDGSVSEGVSDFTAVLQSGDPRMSPNFFTNGGGSLRNLNNNNRYPDDFSGNAQLVHSNGLIIGGALYDTWLALQRDLGQAAAFEAMSNMFVGMLRGGPDIPGTYDDIVFADDDDGNLGNGTPHLCQIIEGFEQHGLGPVSAGQVTVTHTPIVNPTAGLPIQVGISVGGLTSCNGGSNGSLTSGTLRWREIGANGWNTVSMTTNGTTATGNIPAQAMGKLIEYYVTASTNTGAGVQEPAGGDIRPHTFFVGETVNIGCTRLDLNDAGLTSELVAGTASAGANDWQWGRPNGLGGDPNTAFSGLSVWGNDLGPSGFNGLYQADKHNRLTSPQLALRHYDGAFLNYRRWLTVEDGFYDTARIVIDGLPVWTNHASSATIGTEHHIDTAWASHVVPLGFGANDGRVTLNWEIISDGGAEFGGWNIDDLCIKAPATADNRLGISNLRLTSVSTNGTNRLAFTAPKHGPVSEVRVVRTNGRFPNGPDDGDVVFSAANPALLENFTVADRPPLAQRTDARYAVYASDGVDWLGFTIEGWNAVRVP